MPQKRNFANKRSSLSLLLALFITVLVVAACGGAASTPAEESMTDQGAISDEAMTDKEMPDEAMQDGEMMADEETMSDEAMADEHMADAAMFENEVMANETMADGETMALPNRFETELTNVNTGETLKIADFQDRVVLVETMAVWCSNCLRQQREVQALHDLLGDQPNLVSVALDIDPNETNDILKAHTDKNDFEWVYAVAPTEVAREIGQRSS